MRVFSRNYHATTTDKVVIDRLNKMLDLTDKELYKMVHKQQCELIRQAMGIQDVIGLFLKKDLSAVDIVPFPVKATIDNYYTMRIDEDGNVYIEVEEGVDLID